MDFTKRTIFKIFAKKRAASKGRSPILPLLGAGGFSLHVLTVCNSTRLEVKLDRRRTPHHSTFSPCGSLACMLGVVLLAAYFPRLHTPRTCTKTAF